MTLLTSGLFGNTAVPSRVNYLLNRVASGAILTQEEYEGIARSTNALRERLVSHLSNQISHLGVFGSGARGTMLPRSYDADSDVDFMVVFVDGSYQPQTYLDRLSRFAYARYPSSDISQDHPTIKLELNHIRFELVPAVIDHLGNCNIPSRASGYQRWQLTDPNGFNQQLDAKDLQHGGLIRPLVRVLKAWNAKAGHPFESFDLEQRIVGLNYHPLATELRDLFYTAVDGLWLPAAEAQWKRVALDQLKWATGDARDHEIKGGRPTSTSFLSTFFPDV